MVCTRQLPPPAVRQAWAALSGHRMHSQRPITAARTGLGGGGRAPCTVRHVGSSSNTSNSRVVLGARARVRGYCAPSAATARGGGSSSEGSGGDAGSQLGQVAVPVTLLSGFLGAGKTTLLNHILSADHGKRVAVLVNDMAEVNIDADLIRQGGGGDEGGGREQALVQLENGCICCTLRDDLVQELAGLAKQGEVDHIVVESTGVSEPLPVAQTFSAEIKEGIGGAAEGLESLNDVARLHSLVTVVDCSTFLEHLDSIQNLEQIGMATGTEDTRPLAFLLAEQVQFANKILVNKTDLVTAEQAGKVEGLLRRLNPGAEIQRTQQSVTDVPTLLTHQAYDEAEFSSMTAWAEELAKTATLDSAAGDAPPKSEAEEYGIKHFTVRVLGRPFHPERWHAVLRNFEIFGGVMRAKGCFWTAAEPSTRIDYSLVGNTVNVVVNTVWSQVGMEMLRKSIEAGRFKDQAEHVEKAYQRLANEASRMKTDGMWDPVTHDRRVDLVFIGDIDVMDEDRIRAEIEGALLDPAELESFLQGKGPKLEPGKNPFAQVPRCVKL